MQQQPINPYEAPQQMVMPPALGNQSNVYMQDACLLVPRQYEFPPICFKTGETTDLAKPITRNLAWYHPAWALLIFVNFLIFLIVVLCIQKKAKITMYLTEKMRQQRRMRLMINWVVFLSAAPLFFYAIAYEEFMMYGILAAIGAILTSLVLAATWTRLISVRRIDDQYVHLFIKDTLVRQRIFDACMNRLSE